MARSLNCRKKHNFRVELNVRSNVGFFDVSGDNNITPLDALLVIYYISRLRRPSGEGEMCSSEPEQTASIRLHDAVLSSWDTLDNIRQKAEMRRLALGEPRK